jgi:hypothetical protein
MRRPPHAPVRPMRATQCNPEARLPALYLVDCMLKTSGEPYLVDILGKELPAVRGWTGVWVCVCVGGGASAG